MSQKTGLVVGPWGRATDLKKWWDGRPHVVAAACVVLLACVVPGIGSAQVALPSPEDRWVHDFASLIEPDDLATMERFHTDLYEQTGVAANANAGLNSALGRLLAIAENYPELRSNHNFIRLQDELAGTENRVAVERQRYNDAVRVYRTDIRRFPNNLLARAFGFGEREYFEANEGASEVPQVMF